ncbi:hypothetical protein SAMN04488058_11911 [Deinococcus reticulitermitis]|uniref:Preprotein translocase subunit SecB n=1 Tax=Deinococcus reticulitermitis TaxID=856736 RepID=A0A1H7BPL1_9DEIO|nr:hypothetical protein [Deinococcus reticulitermitis]SEJ79519.1 hypothetical protein SAMN04488058_11911 [Deinococcus reticulitermitis]
MPRASSRAAAPQTAAPDAQTYDRFVAGVQPVSIELVSVSASAVPSNLPTVSLRVESEFLLNRPQREDDAQRFVVEARLRLHFLLEGDSRAEATGDRQEVGHFDALYRLTYQADLTPTDALLDDFARRNAPVNVWPFMRELVLNLTQRFGWTGFVLPSFYVPGAAQTGREQADAPAKATKKAPKAKGPSAKAAAPARKPRKAAG